MISKRYKDILEKVAESALNHITSLTKEVTKDLIELSGEVIEDLSIEAKERIKSKIREERNEKTRYLSDSNSEGKAKKARNYQRK